MISFNDNCGFAAFFINIVLIRLLHSALLSLTILAFGIADDPSIHDVNVIKKENKNSMDRSIVRVFADSVPHGDRNSEIIKATTAVHPCPQQASVCRTNTVRWKVKMKYDEKNERERRKKKLWQSGRTNNTTTINCSTSYGSPSVSPTSKRL